MISTSVTTTMSNITPPSDNNKHTSNASNDTTKLTEQTTHTVGALQIEDNYQKSYQYCNKISNYNFIS